MNILIVEDNDIQLQSLYKILSEKYTEDSFTYMLADNYDEATVSSILTILTSSY